MFDMEFKFSKMLSMSLKSLCLVLFKATIWLSPQSTAHALRHLLSNQGFAEGNGKKEH